MSKRILSLVLALVMVLGTFGTVFAAEPSGNEKVDWLVEEGVVLGDAGGLRLADPISRAEVATMVVRALDLEDVAKASAGFASPFTDMNAPGVVWARGHVTVAAGKGIVNGYLNGEFRPANDITYAEVAAMMVRVLGGLTEAEEKTAVWPTTYLAKAVQLGVFDGVEGIADYNAPATREKMFEMVYNAIVNKEFGNYTIVKAIVLENYRVEKLGKDEVVIEVIKEVQRANQLDTAIYERGDQEKLVIEAKVGDVEDLLGKVANFTLDKSGKVVKITEDTSYKTEIMDATASKNKFGSYTVELSERYKGTDERIYRTYYNNKGFAYEDFYSQDKEDRTEFDVEYAKVTTKNGKVLFIDAFNFDDIAPVKEVKKDGAEVYVYNDARDGSVKKYTLKDSTKVLLVNDGNISLGSMKDIQVNDVVHEFDGGFIVRTDAVVTGEFVKVSEARNGDVFVHVDEEEYLVGTEANKMPVYAFDEDAFYTLEAKFAAGSLKEFREEQVTALLDVAGNLQFIGSELESGEFVGIVTKVVGKDMRVLKTDGKTYDYTADLDTKVNGKSTGHKGLNDLDRGALVYMTVNGDIIEKVYELTETGVAVDGLTTREIKLNGEDAKRILNETNVFVSEGTKIEARTVKAVVDAFDANAKKTTGQIVFKAYVVDGDDYSAVAPRRPNAPRGTEAHTIVFTQIEIPSDLKSQVVEFNGFADRQETQMRIILEDGTREVRDVDATLPAKALKGGDIIEIKETKDDDKEIREVKLLIANDQKMVFEVKKYDRTRNLELIDANGDEDTFFVDNKTAIFGNLGNAKRVSYALDGTTKYVKAILVEKDNAKVNGLFDGTSAPDAPVTSGVVTYINTAGTAFEVDGVIYNITAATVLKDGTTTTALGLEVGAKLAVGDQVKVEGNVITRTNKAADRAAAKSVDDAIALLKIADKTAPTQAERSAITNARTAYGNLTATQKALVTKLADLVALEAIVEKADEPTPLEAINGASNEIQLYNALVNAKTNNLLSNLKAQYFAAINNATDLDAVQGAVDKVNATYAMPTATFIGNKLTVKVNSDITPYELEVDHSLQGTLPEFSVYASTTNPYGNSKADFEAKGVTVDYADGTWIIDFGVNNLGTISFYLSVKDAAGNNFGSMYNGGYLTVN